MLVNQLKDHVILDETAAENIELALESTHHVLKLSSRIQNKLDFIYLKESEFWLSEVIDSAIYLLQPYLNSDINIIKNYEVDVKVLGDSIHLQETFLNIIKNAIEAMESKGEIVIKIYKTKRKLFIDFKDSGKGIKKMNFYLC